MRVTTTASTVALATLGLARSATAAITVDGSLDAGYGSARAVQAAATGFGSSTGSSPTSASGSELDAGYGTVQNGILYVFLAGDLQTNFNKLDLFVQAGSGGSNQLQPVANNPGTFNNMANDGSGNGLKFDAGFAPTRWVSLTTDGTNLFVDTADLRTATGGFAGMVAGRAGVGFVGPFAGGDATNIPASLAAALNDANNSGSAANGSVSTGAEVAISLADLGYTGGTISVAAFVNGGNNDFLSNQVLGSLPAGTGNLGGDGAGNFNGGTRGVDFTQFAGDQFFTVAVPEPTGVMAAVVAGVAAAVRRRRR